MNRINTQTCSLIATLVILAGVSQEARAVMKTGYATVNGLKMYYEVHGESRPDAPPLVLLHGGGSTIDTTFGKVLPHLARTRQVVAFDQQGHGRTADITDRPFTFEQSADDAVALLDHLKVEKADFFGFSNGGNIAMQVAIRHPKRVRKLVVASAMYARAGIYPEVWEFIQRSTLRDMPAELKEGYLKVAPHPEQLQSFHDKSAKRMVEFKDWSADDVRSIDAHTLILTGDADSVRPEHAVEMFRLLPRAQLAILPGGHGAAIGEASASRFEGSQVRFGVEPSASARESKLPELVAAMVDQFLDAPIPDPRARASAAVPTKPEDWPGVFEPHLNAGDLDGVLALYEPDARFVAKSGETIVGREKIRPVLAGLIEAKTQLHSRVLRSVTIDDVAILYTDFEGSTVDPSGKSVEMRSRAIEVLRRQPDGTWRLILGDPNGRA